MRLTLVALAVLLTCNAQAQSLKERMGAQEFHAAGLDKLNADELARLDAWLAGQREAAPAARADSGPPVRTATHATPRRFIRQGEGAVHSRAKGHIANWTRGTVFELDNGQKWEVVAGEAKLYRALDNPQVTVVPGLGGRWFLQIDADPDVAKPKVERIE